MLGRFLEVSVATMDIQASLDFYGRLGFSQTPVGEAWLHPYAVVTDGRICIGLHEREIASPTLTFVRPDLLGHLAELERRALPLQYRRLGGDVFNEVAFFDPCGYTIRLIEARSFSPSRRRSTEFSHCGYFEEIALPCADPPAAKRFWEDCGFVGMEETGAWLPHISCTSDTIDIGLYDARQLRHATLRFDAPDISALSSRLAVAGIEPAALPAPLAPQGAVLLIAPEGTHIMMANLG
jgi:catechol 2,3-dioxygenase-like lactoylglutathione lyase family enzyme